MLVSWVMPPYYLLARYQHLRAMLTLFSFLILHPEDEGNKFVCNIGIYLAKYVVTSHMSAVLMHN